MSESTAFPPLIDDCWILSGPTASGKSSVALELARRIEGEIISLDSMAVYRGMDIGTAKPSAAERGEVRHHAIDLVDPDQSFSVAQFLKEAHRAVAEVRDRGKTPIMVGGTPMYVKGILRGFDPGPPPDWEFRRSIEADVQKHGLEALRRRLQQVDPLSAYRLHPHDLRRMTRALEVARVTGEPLSHRQMQFEQQRQPHQCRVWVFHWPRVELHRRIDRRVVKMFAAGLVDETRGLLEKYAVLSPTARKAVGYAEVIEHFCGTLELAETIDKVQTHTRQLARRQETFLRSFGERRVLAMSSTESISEKVGQLLDNARDYRPPPLRKSI